MRGTEFSIRSAIHTDSLLERGASAVTVSDNTRDTISTTRSLHLVNATVVRLDKIYTRSGDGGETGIGDGTRVSKLDARIVAGGSVDELNCLLGVVAASSPGTELAELTFTLQNLLFDLGADISCPLPSNEDEDRCPRIADSSVKWIETEIDQANEKLSPLTSFVLPGGSPTAAHLHLARAVCRRAEVDVLRLAEATSLNPQVCVFVNRLSDLLFVLARQANNNGSNDVLWVPGREPGPG